MRRVLLFTGVAIGILWNRAYGEGKLSGYLFGDFYYVAADHDTTLTSLEGQNGFWIRRAYFTYDNDFEENFTARFRIEVNSPGDFKTSGLLNPYVKDAYVKWNPKGSRHSILFGLSATPTWDLSESLYGYRSVEKTPLDIQKFAGARDLGIAFQGSFDEEKKFGYHLLLANGEGTKSETNKEKKAYLALDAKPTKSLVFQVYGDIEGGKMENMQIITLQGFAYLGGDPGRIGVLVARQTIGLGVDSAGADVDTSLILVSGFGVKRLSSKVSIFARGDLSLNGNVKITSVDYLPLDPTIKNTIVIVGFDYKLGEKVNILPNVEVVSYSVDVGEAPDADILAKLTVFYKF